MQKIYETVDEKAERLAADPLVQLLKALGLKAPKG